MEKKKETPWTDKKLMYKDGNVDVYRYFNWETWKRMTAGERAMWTELSEATPAPISKEVIDFNKKIATKADKIVKPKSKVDKIPEHKDKTRDVGDEKLRELAEEEVKKSDQYNKALEATRAELKKRKIPFTWNSKLKTLQKKLADADNPE